MELRDVVISETFWMHTGAFRWTDIGTRRRRREAWFSRGLATAAPAGSI